MLTQAEIKFLKSLSVKKYRKLHRQYLIEGYRLVKECITANSPVEKLWLTDIFLNSDQGVELIAELDQRNLTWKSISNSSLAKITDTRHPQGIIALLPLQQFTSERVTDRKLLILDNISDPGNLGTLLRTAEWFGLETVVLSENSVDPFSPKVVRSAMGAHFYLSLYIKNLVVFLSDLQTRGYQLIGGVLGGEPVTSLQRSKAVDWALVLGSEAHGLDPTVEGLLSERVTIPRMGHVESLNLAAAGAILLKELTSSGKT